MWDYQLSKRPAQAASPPAISAAWFGAVHCCGKLLWDNSKGESAKNKVVNRWVKPTYCKGRETKL